jgi:5'-nucleotidase
MNFLLTNDDGIRAPGLVAMYKALATAGPTQVVAPETVQSATGHGITLSAPLLTEQVNVEGVFTGTSVLGRPADCVKVALAQIVKTPIDLVVSGINSGANVGINVLYSGTVAAAIEAAFLGKPAVAVSLLLRSGIEPDYDTAARHTLAIIQKLAAGNLLAPGQVISINLPPLTPGQAPAGVKLARQCTQPWADAYDKRLDPRGRTYYWNSSIFTLGPTEADTDVAALRDGYITLTPLQFDLTDRKLMSSLASHF